MSGILFRRTWPCAGGRRPGFTLIEMVIVLAVLAVLIGVLVPQFRGTQREAVIQRARSELRTLATALESYYIHNSNAFPSELSSLMSAVPRIVSAIVDDPFRRGSYPYTYEVSGNRAYYVLFSYGPNRAAELTAISNTGTLTGAVVDDICVTNGTPAGTPNC